MWGLLSAFSLPAHIIDSISRVQSLLFETNQKKRGTNLWNQSKEKTDFWLYDANSSYFCHAISLKNGFDNYCRTICEKQSWISSDVYGFSRAIEAFGVERYKKNAKKVNLYWSLVPSNYVWNSTNYVLWQYFTTLLWVWCEWFLNM